MTRDLALVRRLLSADEVAFELFFASYFPRVFRFARVRLGGDDDAAEDVAQATLVRAVRKLATYRGDAPLFTWLCTFCRHEVAAYLARMGRTAHEALSIDDADAGVSEALSVLADDDPAGELERQEVAAQVRETLCRLPAPYGHALEWKYMQGLSVDEIATRLGLGYKAAESLLTRARVAFRGAFAHTGAPNVEGTET